MREFPGGFLPLLLLPAVLSGCCTGVTVDYATHTRKCDRVDCIERAFITPDHRLVIFLNGRRAEASHTGPFTITVQLPGDSSDGVWVHRDEVATGWIATTEIPADWLRIAVGTTVVLPAYESANYHREHFREMAGAGPVLCLIHHEQPDGRATFFFHDHGESPGRMEILVELADVKTPYRYPLLLFLPVTFAVDVVTFPLQWMSMGDRFPQYEGSVETAAHP